MERLRHLGVSETVIAGRLPRAGALAVSQMYYPGLRDTVNGQPAPVLRADLFLSAVPVPRGETSVTLEYAPKGILATSLF